MRAMAPPMPPLAPVTRALRPVRSNMTAPLDVERGPELGDLVRFGDRQGLYRRGDPSHKPGQHLAGPDLDEGRDSVPRHAGDALAPSNGARDLPDESVTNGLWLGDGCGLDIGDD